MKSIAQLVFCQVAGMFFFNIVESRCIAYNVVALLAEVNTIFLHSRKLLQMCRFRFDHWLYRFNAAMNLFTFVACRFLCLAWIVVGMFIWYDRVSYVYFAVLACSMFVMWVINVGLFWRLISSDLLRPRQRRCKRPKENGETSSPPELAAVADGNHFVADGNNHIADGKNHFIVNSNNNKHDGGVVRNGMKSKLL